jgi:hypothetical protein
LPGFRIANPFSLAAVTACAAAVLAAIGGAVYLGIPHHQNAAATSGPHATGVASAPASAAGVDPPRGFPGGAGTPVGSADAVVSDGLAYSFEGSDTFAGAQDNGAAPSVHAVALGTGAGMWQRPLPELGFPLTGPSLPPLAVAATPDGRRWVYYAGIVLLKGTGTQADQLKMEAGALDARTGAPGWVTEVSLPPAYLQTAESVTGNVEAGLMGAGRDHLVVEVTSTDDPPVTFGLSTTAHGLSWTATGFQPAGLAGDVVVGMTVAGAFNDYGTPEALNARTGATAWTAPGLDVQTHGISGPPAVITPEIATFETQDGLSDQTYLVSTRNGKLLKTLPDSYTCMYDQISVVACYSSPGVDTATLVGLDATSLKQLWALPDPAGTRVAPKLHAAYKGLLYTEADNGNVILNARTGTDLVTDAPIAPDLVVPGYGLVRDDSNGDNTLLAYPATA